MPKISRRSLLATGLAPLALYYAGSSHATAAATYDGLQQSTDKKLDEDGYRAWLRYSKIGDDSYLQACREKIANIVILGNSDTCNIVKNELQTALSSILDKHVDTSASIANGSIILGTPRSKFVSDNLTADEFSALGPEGYIIRNIEIGANHGILIASQTDVGTLYGAFAFLRALMEYRDLNKLSLVERPKNGLRILAHWDNSDGTIERGYGGQSLWNWHALPQNVDPRLVDYARLNASIGLNGVVLNNVNAEPGILKHENLERVAALAKLFRPYGLKTYICPNFAAPCKLDGLATADPFDTHVIDWWQKKAGEIYKLIPDFGGFLVKANSEGIPGPQDYGRTHADGANLLANAVAPHGGIVMWRAFVYTVGNQDPDRVKRAFLEFEPLDGKFADNVLVQVKNGPLDFQPREPFHPLFGAMPKTRLVAELQVTQEYTGQSTHLVYLASSWKEVLESDTHSKNRQNPKVSSIVESTPGAGSGGFSAGANTGTDRNWCGHHFAQANWFAYGRLAWDPDLQPSSIADEWIKLTWTHRPEAVKTINDIMLKSYEAYVSYTMPLGLHHMVGGDHYAPLPEGEGDPRGIFHHAAADGIGYDRTREGSDAVDQYNAPLNDIFNNVATCPDKYLLWFHHLPWNFKMKSGRTLWEELCYKYDSGIKTAREMEQQWLSMKPYIDERRHQEVALKLKTQADDAEKWSAKCLTYFAQYSKLQRVRT